MFILTAHGWDVLKKLNSHDIFSCFGDVQNYP